MLTLSACATHAPESIPLPPPEVTIPDQAGLTVILAWDAPVDLDLYVTDPTWETVYFANNPSRSGAKLVKDLSCKDIAAHPGRFEEMVHIADPAPGGYRIGVDFIETCSGEIDQAAFRVAAVMHGKPPEEKSGTVHLEHFLPRVAEYRLRGDVLSPTDLTESGRIER